MGGPGAGPCRATSEWAVVLSAQGGDSCPDIKEHMGQPDPPCQVAQGPRVLERAGQGAEGRT